MVDSNEMTLDEEQRLLSRIAGYTILRKRLDELLADAKNEFKRTHRAGVKVPADFDGLEAATVSIGGGSDGKWAFKDPVAYGEWLTTHGHEDMVETVHYPKAEALTQTFMTGLVTDEDDPVPDGVEWTSPRDDTVKVVLRRNIVEHAFDPKRLAGIAMPLITGPTTTAA